MSFEVRCRSKLDEIDEVNIHNLTASSEDEARRIVGQCFPNLEIIEIHEWKKSV